MNEAFTGQGMSRVDGKLKVCGRATFAGEQAVPKMTHAALLTSTVPEGRISKMAGRAYVGDALVAEAELMSTVVDR